jgi:hypothetical protein
MPLPGKLNLFFPFLNVLCIVIIMKNIGKKVNNKQEDFILLIKNIVTKVNN